jgi:hypothetical protein
MPIVMLGAQAMRSFFRSDNDQYEYSERENAHYQIIDNERIENLPLRFITILYD